MTAAEPPAQSYELRVDQGHRKYGLSFASDTIALDADGLAWTASQKPRRQSYRDIRMIRLQKLPRGSHDAGLCHIEFADGVMLRVRSAGRLGLSDPERTARYRLFVEALHGHLQAAGAASVAFHGGNTEGRHMVALVALFVWLVLFVLLPIILSIVMGSVAVFCVALGGVVVALMLGRMLVSTRPVTYTSDRIPPELMP